MSAAKFSLILICFFAVCRAEPAAVKAAGNGTLAATLRVDLAERNLSLPMRYRRQDEAPAEPATTKAAAAAAATVVSAAAAAAAAALTTANPTTAAATTQVSSTTTKKSGSTNLKMDPMILVLNCVVILTGVLQQTSSSARL